MRMGEKIPLKKRVYDALLDTGDHTAYWLHEYLGEDLRSVSGALVSLRRDGKVLCKDRARNKDPSIWAINPRWYPIKSNRGLKS